MPLICGLGILVGIIPAYILLNTPLGTSANDQIFFYSLAAFTGFIVSAPSANVKAIIMNVNRPEHRGTVFSLFNITDNLGMGMGPAVGGLLVPFGYVFMMNFAVSWWIPCGIFFLMVMLFITKDRDALRAVLSDRAKEMKKEQEAR
jgi:MFS family permease